MQHNKITFNCRQVNSNPKSDLNPCLKVDKVIQYDFTDNLKNVTRIPKEYKNCER